MKIDMKQFLALIVAIVLLVPGFANAAEKKAPEGNQEERGKIPSHVLNISKENTYPNSTQDQMTLEPSELTRELIEGSEVKIENPQLIKMLNETNLRPSPVAIGYRGMIYMGHWPLQYESQETSINWQYQKINQNQLNNLGGKETQKLNYNQEAEKHIKGGLTAKIDKTEDIKKMMLLEAQDNTDLPLSFHTVFGKGTKKDNSYGIPPKKIGTLSAFAPAVNEKGKVTFGEVYIELKGSKKYLVVKNVTKQGIGAWIPIQDHISFNFSIQ
ncbi:MULTISPECIES: YfkD famly protein [Pontibacillus]|uniref:YfkD family protein n=1 Tax=Pontibacillus chungwhensis TaxID=265426 RepID=A0ABY8V436_9BACI|nr:MULTISPECIES: YfkD famly protein [Pontibacillus]MCD5325478.1 YfkD family protein [Pontibacillus sp. HN14]WIF98591.1 YfkD family protein [Pontibacillus chungwhensis]